MYLYEVDRSSSTGFSARPRQCVPEAFVEFESQLPLESPMPSLSIPRQSVQRRRRNRSHSSSGSASNSTTNHQISHASTASTAFSPDGQNVGYFQQFLPYRSKSTVLHCHPSALTGGFVPPLRQKSPPSYSSIAGQGCVSPQGISQRPVTDERMSTKADATSSATKDDVLKLLMLCQNIVIKLLQNFAREMNGIAGAWKSGCTIANTPGLLAAVSAVQELRQMFQQLAPKCQQFYKFVTDAFSGRCDSLPHIGVIQEQMSTLNTCNSTMLCVFSQYQLLLGQKISAVQTGGMLVQAIISTKHILQECLKNLRRSLGSLVSDLHSKKQADNTSEIVECRAGQVWHQPSVSHPVVKPSLPQELNRQTTFVPSVTGNLSPSLASLLAMTGELKKTQHHFMLGDNTTAGNYLPFHVDAVQGDDSSSLGLQIPIVIAPDESLIDEVVKMDAKPPDEEDTCGSMEPPVKAIKQEKVEVLRRKFARQTVFIDADEMPPENLICSRRIKTEYDLNVMTDDLNANVQDEKNSALNLAKVYLVMPDKSDDDQAGDVVQQSALTEAATAPESLKDGLKSAENVWVEPVGFHNILEQDKQAAMLSPCVLDLSTTHSEPGSAVSEEISANNGDHCCDVVQKSAPTAIKKKKRRLKTRKREFVKLSNLNFNNRHVSHKDWYARLCIRKAKLSYCKLVSTEREPQSCEAFLEKSQVIKNHISEDNSVPDVQCGCANSIDVTSNNEEFKAVSFAGDGLNENCSKDLQPVRDHLSGVATGIILEEMPSSADTQNGQKVGCDKQELLLKSEMCAMDILHRPSSVSSCNNSQVNLAIESVCDAPSLDSVKIPVSAIKIEPVMSNCEASLTEQLPPQHESVSADIIAEVVASTAEFTENADEEEAENESGCLKIKIENVCSIATEGFDNIDDGSCVKGEHSTNWMDVIHTQHEDIDKSKIIVASSNVQGSREVVSELCGLTDEGSCLKERISQDDEFVDVGEVEYGLPVKSVDSMALLKVDNPVHKKDGSQFDNFDDSDVEVDVFYENASTKDDSDLSQSEENLCGVSAGDLENSEVLKFYSLGGDTYETADVHSALNAMSRNVTRKALADSSVAEKKQNQPRSRKRRKRSVFTARTRKKLKASDKALISEVGYSGRALDEINNDCAVRELIDHISCAKQTKQKSRRQAGKSAVDSASLQSELNEATRSSPRQKRTSGILSDSKELPAVTHSEFFDSCESSCTGPESARNATDIVESVTPDKVLTKRSWTRLSMESQAATCDDTLTPVASDNQEVISDSGTSGNINRTTFSQEPSSIKFPLQEKPAEALPYATKRVTRCRRKRNTAVNELIEKPRLRSSEAKVSMDYEHQVDFTVSESDQLADENMSLEKKVTDSENDLTANAEESLDRQGPQCVNDDDFKNISSNVECENNTSKDGCSALPSSSVESSFVENVTDVSRPKRRKRRYAMTTKPKRRKKSKNARQRMGHRISIDINDFSPAELTCSKEIDVESSEKPEDFIDHSKPGLPLDSKEQTLAIVQNLVHDLFASKLPVIGQTKPFRYNEGTGKKSESPSKARRRKRRRDRRIQNAITTSATSLSLLDMLNDDKFLENLKSAVTAVSTSSEAVGGGSGFNTDIMRDNQSIIAHGFHANGSHEYNDDGQFETCDNFPRASSNWFQQDYASIKMSDTLGNDAAISRCQISYDSVLNDGFDYDLIRNALETIASNRNVSIQKSFADGTGESPSGTREMATTGLTIHSTSSKPVSSVASETTGSVASTLATTNPVQALNMNCVPTATKTVIPLSVYLKNVREANYKQMKDSEGNCTTPAFYTGVIHNPFDGQANNQHRSCGRDVAPVCTRDPRVARMRSQSTDLPLCVQVEENVVDQDTLNKGHHSKSLFHSFSFTGVQENSKPNVAKLVCAISPFMYKSDKPAGNEEKLISESKNTATKTDAVSERHHKCHDGGWRLIPISNLLPRPPIIFARLLLSERQITTGYSSDPRVFCDRDLSVCKKLRKPDQLSDDTPLIIDEADAMKIVKPRNSLDKIESIKTAGVSSECELVRERNGFMNSSLYEDAQHSEVVTNPENEMVKHLTSPLKPGDDILQDLLMSIESGAYEIEVNEKPNGGMICGLNKDRVLGNRSYAVPNVNVTSDKLRGQPNSAHLSSQMNDNVLRRREGDSRSSEGSDKNVKKSKHLPKEGNLIDSRPHLHRNHAKDNGQMSQHHKIHFKRRPGNSSESRRREKPHGKQLPKELREKSSGRAGDKVARSRLEEMVKYGENSHGLQKKPVKEKGHKSQAHRKFLSHRENKLAKGNETLKLCVEESERCNLKSVDISNKTVELVMEHEAEKSSKNDKVIFDQSVITRSSLDESCNNINVNDFPDCLSVTPSSDMMRNLDVQEFACRLTGILQELEKLGEISETNKGGTLESDKTTTSREHGENDDGNKTLGDNLFESEESDHSSLVILLDDEDAAEPERTDRCLDRDLQKPEQTGRENSSSDDPKGKTSKDSEFPDCTQESFPLSIRIINQSNDQIRAEILKSIQTLKSSLEHRLKSAAGDCDKPWEREPDVCQTPDDNYERNYLTEKPVHGKGDSLTNVEKNQTALNENNQNIGDSVQCLKKLDTDSGNMQTAEGHDDCGQSPKADGSSELSDTRSSSKPSSQKRPSHSPWKVANEWSNISSQWTEMSRDYDIPVRKDNREGSVIGFMRLLSKVPAETLAAYKEVMKREIASAEQKIVIGKTFSDPFDGLNESQIRKLPKTKSASPSHDQEVLLECYILALVKELNQTHESMEEIKAQLSVHPSPALDKTYNDQEQKYNILNVKMDMYQYRRSKFRRYQKSNFVHVIPDEFLFDEEFGRYVSLEGMLMFLNEPTIHVEKCIHLAALKREILHVLSVLEITNTRLTEDIKRLEIKLGWLHLQRKLQFQELCCTSKQVQLRLRQTFEEKVTSYR